MFWQFLLHLSDVCDLGVNLVGVRYYAALTSEVHIDYYFVCEIKSVNLFSLFPELNSMHIEINWNWNFLRGENEIRTFGQVFTE